MSEGVCGLLPVIPACPFIEACEFSIILVQSLMLLFIGAPPRAHKQQITEATPMVDLPPTQGVRFSYSASPLRRICNLSSILAHLLTLLSLGASPQGRLRPTTRSTTTFHVKVNYDPSLDSQLRPQQSTRPVGPQSSCTAPTHTLALSPSYTQSHLCFSCCFSSEAFGGPICGP